jgi:prophage maintenance system killer protein
LWNFISELSRKLRILHLEFAKTIRNKRIAASALFMMLRLNNVQMSNAQSELIALGLGIANGAMDYEAVEDWIHGHLDE